MSERERIRTATIARLTNKKGDGGLRVRDSGTSIQTGKSGCRSAGMMTARPDLLCGFLGDREIAESSFEPETSGSVVHKVEFDAHVSPPRILRCDERGAGTAEWIQNDTARRTESVDKRLKGLDRLLRGVQQISGIGKINDI